MAGVVYPRAINSCLAIMAVYRYQSEGNDITIPEGTPVAIRGPVFGFWVSWVVLISSDVLAQAELGFLAV